jgi:hypothetical protein
MKSQVISDAIFACVPKEKDHDSENNFTNTEGEKTCGWKIL